MRLSLKRLRRWADKANLVGKKRPFYLSAEIWIPKFLPDGRLNKPIGTPRTGERELLTSWISFKLLSVERVFWSRNVSNPPPRNFGPGNFKLFR